MSSAIPRLTDIMPKPRLRRQLHTSALEMLSKCGILFEYVYIKGMRRPPGIFTLVGTATHRTIHHDLKTKLASGVLAEDADIKDTASRLFDETLQREPVEPTEEDLENGLTLARAKDKAIGLAMLHHTGLAPSLQPVAVERPFSLSLDDFLLLREHELRELAKKATGYARDLYRRMATAHFVIRRDGCDLAGQQDVKEVFPTPFEAEGTHTLTMQIRDTKTTAKSPNSEAANHSLQLAAYATASTAIDCSVCGHPHTAGSDCRTCGCTEFHGRLPDRMFLDYLVETPKLHDRYIKSIPTIPQQSDVDMFLNRVSNAVYALHSGVFVPAKTDDWWCSKKWCGFWSICPYAKKPATTVGEKPKLVQLK